MTIKKLLDKLSFWHRWLRAKMKLPECSGRTSWTDWGHEFDCDAIHGQSCEDCLCTYKSLGGLWHPETGKKIHPVIALLRYGAKNTDKKQLRFTHKQTKE